MAWGVLWMRAPPSQARMQAQEQKEMRVSCSTARRSGWGRPAPYRSNSSGSKQQGALWGSSKLNAAAEPYAPSWAASTRQQQQQQQPVISSPAPDSTLAEPSAQTEQEVPAHNHLFQGLVQEVRSGLPEGSRTDGPHQNGQQQGRAAGEAVEAGGSSTSGGNSGPSTATPSTQASAEGAPPASRPLSVLQPNPSWKPPPPPMPT
eukprot:scaffold130210_cov17-Tisochrysis_lutea.AAC.1